MSKNNSTILKIGARVDQWMKSILYKDNVELLTTGWSRMCADVFSKKKRSEVMSLIRSKNTKPELYVRSFLHKQGYRFRLHQKNLPGSPDIVLKKHNVVINVNGCFWHHHKCGKYKIPKTNRKFWLNKLIKTMQEME